MVYKIKVSLYNCRIISTVKKKLIKKSQLCGSKYYYFENEISSRKKNYNQKKNIIFLFPDGETRMESFIRYIKSTKDIFIEQIYRNIDKPELLYKAS